MSFKKKIDMLLKAKKLQKLSINKIEKALNLDGTIYKGVKNPDYVPDPDLVSELVRKYRIKRSWWDKDWETGTLDMFEQNGTDEDISGDNNKKSEDPIWTQIEKSEKYTVVPTIILDKYEILSNREIESRETTLQEVRATMKIAIAAKDEVIAIREQEITRLYKNIAELNAKLEALSQPQQTQ